MSRSLWRFFSCVLVSVLSCVLVVGQAPEGFAAPPTAEPVADPSSEASVELPDGVVEATVWGWCGRIGCLLG